MAIYLGYKLFILGVSGQASLSVNSKSISGQLLNAAPGLFFAVGGIVAIVITVWKGVDLSFTEENPPAVRPEKPGANLPKLPRPGGTGGPRERKLAGKTQVWRLAEPHKD